MTAAARTASDTAVPATKRAEVRCPKLDRSATARSDLLSESAINKALSMEHLIVTGCDCQRLSLALQYFVSQRAAPCSEVVVADGRCHISCWVPPSPHID